MCDATDLVIEQLALELRRLPPTDREAQERVVEAAMLAAAADGRGLGLWRRLTAPRAVQIRPLVALAAAALMVAIPIVAWQIGRGTAGRSSTALSNPPTLLAKRDGGGAGGAGGAALAAASGNERLVVRFELVAPSAREVALVGDFNGWDRSATPLVRAGANGTWVVQIPLTPGRHVYGFVVDGSSWLPDPRAPRAPGDDFGAPSSVIVVGAPL
ncbi:MAG TPA: isoamylase early set domain-containing protein [Gemmatimonadaceae bacterium]|nr:isoamylase early set domain-containing protein [Gemmatimonadaceae bacterium]